MTAPPHAPVDAPARPARWGLGDAILGWVVAQACAFAFVLVLASAFGYSSQDLADNRVSLTFISLQFPALWLGFVAVPVWAAATKGAGWIADFRVRMRALDVPLGVVAGVIAQFVIVPLVSLPVIWLAHADLNELSAPARDLGQKATSPGQVALLFLTVAVGAPLAEELFFRGLVLRAFEKRVGTAWAVVCSSLVFGATHFQVLQFAALTAAGIVFALLVVKTGRLGPAVWAHIAFNAATVASIVWWS